MYGLAHQSSIITAGINIFLAFYVLLKSSGWNRAFNRYFSLLSFGFALWNFGTVFNSTVLIYIGALLLPPAFYAFLLTFLRQFNQLERFYAILLFIISGFTIFSGVYFLIYQPSFPSKTFLNSVLFLTSVPVTVWGIYRLLNAARMSRSRRERSQVILILISLLASAFIGFFACLTVIGLNLVSWTATAGLIYTIAIILAIIKHRMIDTKQLISHLALIFLQSLIVWSLFGLLGHFDLDKQPLTFLSMLTIALVIVIFYESMKNIVEEYTFRIFSPDVTEFIENLNHFGLSINNYIDENTLIKDFSRLFQHSIRIKSFAIYTMNPNQNVLVFREGKDARYQPNEIAEILLLLIENIKSRRGPISRNQLAVELRSGLLKQLQDERLQLYRVLNRLRASEVFPFLFGDHVYGLLSIGLEDPNTDLTKSERDILCGITGRIAAALAHITLEKYNRSSEHFATLGRLATGLAHEIRNPLATIKAGIQYLEQDELLTEAEEFHSIIRDEVDRLERFVNRFLDYARPSIQQNEQPQKPLEEILKKIKTTYSSYQEFKHGNLDIQLDPSAAEIRLPVDSWTHILSNLLTNAFSAIEPKGIVRINAGLTDTKNTLEISIEDTGPGIDENDRLAIFEPFYSKRHGGIGLGLAIVRKIIQGMNGTITCSHSALGGAAFTIRVPLD